MAEEEEEEERREENMFERRMKEGSKFNAATPTTGITKAGEHKGKKSRKREAQMTRKTCTFSKSQWSRDPARVLLLGMV